jgi:outer membrane biosynthesis protein TonB
MNRSPLFYPLSRGSDSDAGGAADLQTDVMRFMAIISLCLVAIFALVQSIPLTPTAEDPVKVDAEPVVESVRAEPVKSSAPVEPAMPVVEKKTEIKLTRPVPTRTIARNDPVALQRPKPAPAPKADPAPAQAASEAPVADTAPSEEGFTLRFETDAALTRLVARQIVGLYAITPKNALRMNIVDDEISFWPASAPGQFHEMDRSTVPDKVLAAFRTELEMNDVKWGVTLPADMSSELNGYLLNERGGALIIASSGQIALVN